MHTPGEFYRQLEHHPHRHASTLYTSGSDYITLHGYDIFGTMQQDPQQWTSTAWTRTVLDHFVVQRTNNHMAMATAQQPCLAPPSGRPSKSSVPFSLTPCIGKTGRWIIKTPARRRSRYRRPNLRSPSHFRRLHRIRLSLFAELVLCPSPSSSSSERRVCRTREIGYSGLGGGRGGGMMTTLVHGHPEQYLHKSRFTRYLHCFPDGGLTKAAFRQAGNAVYWEGLGGVGLIMTTLVHRHPEQYLHKSRYTRYLQSLNQHTIGHNTRAQTFSSNASHTTHKTAL